MAKTTGARVMGLRLTLPGAPMTPHMVPGVPGFFRPDIPTPVGGDGEIPLDEAKILDTDPGVWLELVEVKDVDEARTAAADAYALSRAALVEVVQEARRDGDAPAEVNQIKDEARALEGVGDGGGD